MSTALSTTRSKEITVKEKLQTLLAQTKKIPTPVWVAIGGGVAVGGGIAYYQWRKSKRQYHEVPGTVVRVKVEQTPTQEVPQPLVLDENHPAVADRVQAEVSEEEESGLISRNIFDGSQDEDPAEAYEDGWDYEEELKRRTQTEPYVIHKDEFFENDLDYAQHTWTFYAGDSIMVSEEDAPVYNYETIVGPVRFGHGSGDPNVFYVRNDGTKSEYEILLEPGLYSREILGLEIEENERAADVRHSRRPRKFRDE